MNDPMNTSDILLQTVTPCAHTQREAESVVGEMPLILGLALGFPANAVDRVGWES